MNTIDGLKALPSILNNLLDQRDAIQLQIDACYKPFMEIIQEVLVDPMIKGRYAPSFYISDIDIWVHEGYVCFCIRDHLGKYDDAVVGTYKYPIEAFLSVDTFRKHIANEKPTQPLHEKLGMDERDLHYRGT